MTKSVPETIRLVVSDVDGTLVDGHKQLTSGVIAAVGRLKAAGIGFTVISARPRSGIMPIADTLELDVPMGAFNGGIVFRRDGAVLSHETIDPEVVKGVFELAKDADVDRWLFADDRWFATSDQGTHVEHERIASNSEPVLTNDFTHLYDRADKVTFVSDTPKILADLLKRAQAKYDSRATIGQSQTYYLDVTATAANKGDGITALAKAFDVPLAQTVAFGDQFNDVPMFQRAAWSAAMGQGPEGVRAQADFVSASNDADGVAVAIAEVLRDTAAG
jgi:Cof subfamily protein (haloacid dehalogenase superfamily)